MNKPLQRNSKAQEAADLVADGYSYREAADLTGSVWENVKSACLRRGIEQTAKAAARSAETRMQNYKPYPRQLTPTRKTMTTVAANLHATGKSYSEIADQLGMTRCQVAGIIFRHKRRIERAKDQSPAPLS